MLFRYLRFLRWLGCLGVFIFLIWYFSIINISAATTSTSQAPVSPNQSAVKFGADDLVYWRPGGFWVLNRTTLNETLLHPYAPELDYIASWLTTLDRANNQIYILEIEGRPHQFDDKGQIVQLDLLSGKRSEIWSGSRLRDFELSPDGTRMLVRYHFPLAKNENVQDSVMGTCILTLATGDCRDITDALPWNAPSIDWLDDASLIFRLDRLYLVELESLEWQPVPDVEDWVIRDYIILPGRRLFSNAYRSSDHTIRHFVELELNTLELVQLPIEAQPYPINSLSPDEQHLIYGARVLGAGSGEQTIEVLNLRSGDYFTITLTNPNQIEWFPDSQGALVITAQSANQEIQQDNILYIDLLNEEVRVLGSYQVPLYQPVYILDQ